MKKLLLSITALLMVGGLFAQTADEVNSKYNEAATLLTAKNYKAAIPVLEATIELAETSDADVSETLADAQRYLVISYDNLGKNSARNKKFDESLMYFKKASVLAGSANNIIAKNKADNMIAAVYGMQGGMKVKEEDFAAAATLYDQAVIANPRNTKNVLTAAQVNAKAGNLDKAAEYYESIIKLGDSHSKYKDDADKAKAAYTIDLVNIAVAATDFDSAKSNLDKVLVFDPENATALSTIVKIANNFKNYSAVIANGPKAVAVQTDAAEKSNLSFILGAAYETQKDIAKAIACYKTVTAGDFVAAAKTQAEALSKAK